MKGRDVMSVAKLIRCPKCGQDAEVDVPDEDCQPFLCGPCWEKEKIRQKEIEARFVSVGQLREAIKDIPDDTFIQIHVKLDEQRLCIANLQAVEPIEFEDDGVVSQVMLVGALEFVDGEDASFSDEVIGPGIKSELLRHAAYDSIEVGINEAQRWQGILEQVCEFGTPDERRMGSLLLKKVNDAINVMANHHEVIEEIRKDL